MKKLKSRKVWLLVSSEGDFFKGTQTVTATAICKTKKAAEQCVQQYGGRFIRVLVTPI